MDLCIGVMYFQANKEEYGIFSSLNRSCTYIAHNIVFMCMGYCVKRLQLYTVFAREYVFPKLHWKALLRVLLSKQPFAGPQ